MTLQEAYNTFESLNAETKKKHEVKIYEKFLHILSQLKTRAFSQVETQSIEKELDILAINSRPKNRKKYFKNTLTKFEKFLKDTFSLTTKGYYTKMGIGLGSSFGILFGVVFLSSFERSLGISLGLIVGMSIGLTIGRNMDSIAVSEGRVI
ncbi:MAG: hypothetical protein OCD76_19570 [Reichenbachiella sp.]